jgi:hypothetical protein
MEKMGYMTSRQAFARGSPERQRRMNSVINWLGAGRRRASAPACPFTLFNDLITLAHEMLA